MKLGVSQSPVQCDTGQHYIRAGSSCTPRLPRQQVRLHGLFPWSRENTMGHVAWVPGHAIPWGHRSGVAGVGVNGTLSWLAWERRCVLGGGVDKNPQDKGRLELNNFLAIFVSSWDR